jgi:hypothetical protein
MFSFCILKVRSSKKTLNTANPLQFFFLLIMFEIDHYDAEFPLVYFHTAAKLDAEDVSIPTLRSKA